MPIRNLDFNTFIRRIIITVCTGFITLAIIFALLIIFSPYKPSLRITSADISNFENTSRAEMTATFHMEAVLENRNLGLSIRYERLIFSLWFDNVTISSIVVDPPPFPIRGQSETSVQAQFTVVDKQLPRGLLNEILAQEDYRGTVDFIVLLEARFRYKFGALRSKVHHFIFQCSPLRLAVPPKNTEKAFTPFDCYVV